MQDRRLSCRVLGKRVQVSASHISGIANGFLTPSVEVASRLFSELDVPEEMRIELYLAWSHRERESVKKWYGLLDIPWETQSIKVLGDKNSILSCKDVQCPVDSVQVPQDDSFIEEAPQENWAE